MIRIEYDGSYPNLCSGHLKVYVDDKLYDFGDFCLSSGGSVTFDDEWNEHITEGDWQLYKIPDDFPKELLPELLEKINSEIPHGCCGGCV